MSNLNTVATQFYVNAKLVCYNRSGLQVTDVVKEQIYCSVSLLKKAAQPRLRCTANSLDITHVFIVIRLSTSSAAIVSQCVGRTVPIPEVTKRSLNECDLYREKRGRLLDAVRDGVGKGLGIKG